METVFSMEVVLFMNSVLFTKTLISQRLFLYGGCIILAEAKCRNYMLILIFFFFSDDPSKEGTGLDNLSSTSQHSDLTSTTTATGGKPGVNTNHSKEPFHFIRCGYKNSIICTCTKHLLLYPHLWAVAHPLTDDKCRVRGVWGGPR